MLIGHYWYYLGVEFESLMGLYRGSSKFCVLAGQVSTSKIKNTCKVHFTTEVGTLHGMCWFPIRLVYKSPAF